MSGSVVVNMEGDKAKLWAAFESIIEQATKVEGGLKKTTAASREAAKAQMAMAREAQKISRQETTAKERHVQQLQKLSQMNKAGHLDQVKYSRAVMTAHRQYKTAKEQESGAGAKRAAAADARGKREAKAEADSMGRKRRLAEMSKRVYLDSRTPQEGHIARVKRLDVLMRRTTMTQETYNRAVRRSRAEMLRAGQAGKESFGSSAVTRLAAVAGGYLSIHRAIRVVIDSLEAKLEAERKARDFTLTLGDAQRAALVMLGEVSGKKQDAFLAQIKGISKETGVGMQPLYVAASAGLSASQGDPTATLNALRMAAKVAPGMGTDMQTLAGGILDVRKATGLDDAKKNLGFLLSVGQAARPESIGKIAENLASAIAQITKYGDTPQQAGAFASAFSHAMIDKTGKRSGMAVAKWAGQLEAFLPTEETFKFEPVTKDKRVDGRLYKKGEVERVTDRPGTGLSSTIERVEFLRRAENATLRQQFVADMTLFERAKIPAQQMVGLKGRGDETWQEYQTALTNIIPPGEAAPRADKLIRGLGRPFEQQMAATNRAMQVTRERLRQTVQGKGMAEGGIYGLEALDETLEAAGVGYLHRKVWAAQHRVTPGTYRESYRNIIQTKIRDLESPEQWMPTTTGGGGGSGLRRSRAQMERNKEITDVLREHLEELDKQTEAVREQTSVLLRIERQGRQPPGAVEAQLARHAV